MTAEKTPETKKHQLNPHALTIRILIGMVAGAICGAAIFGLGRMAGPDPSAWWWTAIDEYLVHGLFDVVGQIFMRGLQLLVVPLVFISLTCGTAALEDIRRLGRVGGKTILLYLGTTALAITTALTFAVLLQPGAGFDLEQADIQFTAVAAPSLSEVIINIFPSNPVGALAEQEMLQIIVLAILFGLALTLTGAPGQRILNVMQDLNEVVMKIVTLVMLFAPVGVFALIAGTFATQGYAAFIPLGKYFLVVLGLLLVQGLIVYPALLRALSGLSPIRFLRKMRTVQIFAFSTASSNATLPVTLHTVEKRLGVRRSIGSFTVPLGATVNMDGTAIMQGVATVFIAQAYGIELGLTGYLMVVLIATLASIGTAGVPGVGMLMLAMVFTQVGLPVEAIGIILGVDRLLDMVRTAVNVTGDSMVSCVVAKSEGALDQDVFDGL